MKKFLAVALSLVMVLGLAACAKQAAAPAPAPAATEAATQAAAPAATQAAAPAATEAPKAEEAAPAEDDLTQGDSYQINFASTFPGEGFVHEMFVAAKNEIEEKSGGRIEVVIHPSGALGSTKEIVEGIKEGTIEMGGIGDEDLDTYTPEYSVFSCPYLYRDMDHYVKAMEYFMEPGSVFDQASEKTGAYTIGWVVRGTRDCTANKPIMNPEDLKGLKFRLPSAPVRIAVFEAYGASPTVVDFAELYMALKTGTVDAQENPPETIYTYKYYEAQKYLSLTEHMFTPARATISKVWFDKLDPKDQKLIKDAFLNATKDTYKNNPDPDKYYLDLIEKEGMEIVHPNKEKFLEIAGPVVKGWADEHWAEGLYDTIMGL